MREFKLGEHLYRVGKLNVFDQLLIVKMLAGNIKNIITPDLVAFIEKAFRGFKEGEKPKLTDDDLISLFGPFSEAVGKMPEVDFNRIINLSLGCTQRRQSEIWSSVQVDGVLMFQDISAAQILKIVFEALVGNLGGFFDELPSILGLGERKSLSS